MSIVYGYAYRFHQERRGRGLQKVLHYTQHKDDYGLLPMIWVHQLNGKVCTECPDNPCGYAHIPTYHLCNLDKDLDWIPDRKAIKKWIENEVLMHETSAKKRKVVSPKKITPCYCPAQNL